MSHKAYNHKCAFPPLLLAVPSGGAWWNTEVNVSKRMCISMVMEKLSK